MCYHKGIAVGLFVLICVPLSAVAQAPVPPRPQDIVYPPLDFQLPPPSQFREVLSNGMVVYVAEDRMLPTFDMSVLIRTGSAVEPASKAGLAALAGEQMRDGGTKNLAPDAFDEKVEFLAASMSCHMGDTQGEARLSCLSKDIDEALALFVDMLRYPRFDDGRLRLAKERMLQNIKRRNDSTASIARIEWGFLMDGENHFSNRYPSSKTVRTITRDDLVAFHGKYVHPANLIVAVAGDFGRAAMLGKLEKAFGGWPIGETGPTTFPKPLHTPKPGVYVVNKKDVNQGRVTIGHKAIMRGTADEFPLHVMNAILGASGFRSRLVSRVRSDEGLAYNTGSRFEQGVYYPGDFACWFQSKSNSCAYATRIVLEEINRLREKPVGSDDLKDAIAYFVESFPQRFPDKQSLLETYAQDEYTGRDPNYWRTFVDRIKQVTPEEVQDVAQKHLRPGQLVILAVGDADALMAGGYDKAPDLKLSAFGKVTTLPLRDPDTLER